MFGNNLKINKILSICQIRYLIQMPYIVLINMNFRFCLQLISISMKIKYLFLTKFSGTYSDCTEVRKIKCI
jgi:hypothetical protein